MESIINIERLKVYRSYGGDIDGLLRMKKKSDLDTFGSDLGDIWSKITCAIQDIELITKGLASEEYKDKAISEIMALCDKQAFEELMKPGKIA